MSRVAEPQVHTAAGLPRLYAAKLQSYHSAGHSFWKDEHQMCRKVGPNSPSTGAKGSLNVPNR